MSIRSHIDLAFNEAQDMLGELAIQTLGTKSPEYAIYSQVTSLLNDAAELMSKLYSDRGVYVNRWSCRQNVADDFRVVLEPGIEILFADYDLDSYIGSAYVLFRQGGKLYEVFGAHCSCYGLEGQWTPEPTSVAAVEREIVNGALYRFEDRKDDLRRVLEVIKEAHNA